MCLLLSYNVHRSPTFLPFLVLSSIREKGIPASFSTRLTLKTLDQDGELEVPQNRLRNLCFNEYAELKKVYYYQTKISMQYYDNILY